MYVLEVLGITDPNSCAYYKCGINLKSDIVCGGRLMPLNVNNGGSLLSSIKAYEQALLEFTMEDYPLYYATARLNEGNTYRKLSTIRDKELYLDKSVQSYEQALVIYTIDRYPLFYAKVQYGLGITYSELSDVRNKRDYLNKAIQAYEEALKVYTVDAYSHDHDEVISYMIKAKQMLESMPD